MQLIRAGGKALSENFQENNPSELISLTQQEKKEYKLVPI